MKKMRNNDCQAATPRQPLISIITVVLNGADTLEKAINSVLKQKFKDFEYIIVDGGSVDGTIDILKKYDSKLTQWISEDDEGVYDAMNKAVALTSGKWIYFLGADDQLLDQLETAANYMKDEKTLYYGNVYRPIVDRIYDGKFSAYKLACRNICHQSIFYPRCVWDKYSYNSKYPTLADYELNMRCFSDAEINFQYIPVTIAVFSDEGGLSPTQEDIAFQNEKLSLVKDIFPYWVYILISFRSFFIMFLTQLRLQKISKKFTIFFSEYRSTRPKIKTVVKEHYLRQKITASSLIAVKNNLYPENV